jgi:hypothetical protein
MSRINALVGKWASLRRGGLARNVCRLRTPEMAASNNEKLKLIGTGRKPTLPGVSDT